MRYRVRVNGGDIHFRVDMCIYCDTEERAKRVQKFAKDNKYQCNIEVIDL